MTESLINAGKNTTIRFRKEIAQEINAFAAMHHIESMTEAVHGYIESLKAGKVPISQAILVPSIFCKIWNKEIEIAHCKNLSKVKEWAIEHCAGCKGLTL